MSALRAEKGFALLCCFETRPLNHDPILFQEDEYPFPSVATDGGSVDMNEVETITLENEFLTASICPGLGGRVLKLVTKGTCTDLIYSNTIVKPSRVFPSCSGGYVAGGIQFSSTSEITPLNYKTAQYEYGIANEGKKYAWCKVGDVNMLTGDTWMIEYALPEGSEVLVVRIAIIPSDVKKDLDFKLVCTVPIENEDHFWAFPPKSRMRMETRTGEQTDSFVTEKPLEYRSITQLTNVQIIKESKENNEEDFLTWHESKLETPIIKKVSQSVDYMKNAKMVANNPRRNPSTKSKIHVSEMIHDLPKGTHGIGAGNSRTQTGIVQVLESQQLKEQGIGFEQSWKCFGNGKDRLWISASASDRDEYSEIHTKFHVSANRLKTDCVVRLTVCFVPAKGNLNNTKAACGAALSASREIRCWVRGQFSFLDKVHFKNCPVRFAWISYISSDALNVSPLKNQDGWGVPPVLVNQIEQKLTSFLSGLVLGKCNVDDYQHALYVLCVIGIAENRELKEIWNWLFFEPLSLSKTKSKGEKREAQSAEPPEYNEFPSNRYKLSNELWRIYGLIMWKYNCNLGFAIAGLEKSMTDQPGNLFAALELDQVFREENILNNISRRKDLLRSFEGARETIEGDMIHERTQFLISERLARLSLDMGNPHEAIATLRSREWPVECGRTFRSALYNQSLFVYQLSSRKSGIFEHKSDEIDELDTSLPYFLHECSF